MTSFSFGGTTGESKPTDTSTLTSQAHNSTDQNTQIIANNSEERITAPNLSTASAPTPGTFSFAAPKSSSAVAPSVPASTSMFAPRANIPVVDDTNGPDKTSSVVKTTTQTTKDEGKETKAPRVPSYDEAFPYRKNYEQISSLVTILSHESKDKTDYTECARQLSTELSFNSSGKSVGKSLFRDPTAGCPASISGTANPTPTDPTEAALRSSISSHPYLELHGSLTEITPFIWRNITSLADELGLGAVDAATLYASSHNEHILNKADLNMDEQQNAGFHNFYLESLHDAQTNDWYVPPSNLSTDDVKSGALSEDKAMDAARGLFFHERSAILETVMMLIRARILASTSISSSSVEETHSHRLVGIIEATDFLLQEGLVMHLLKLVRDLTVKNNFLREKICKGISENKNVNHVHSTQNSANGPFTQTGIQISNSDYAWYIFTLNQRHLAAQCLFYLSYHTQLTSSEVCTLIDLVQDLTDGSNDDNVNRGIGKGLPLLDPIRDVPDPYSTTWEQSTGRRNAHERNDDEWMNDLVESLWHVKGLDDATLTSHPQSYPGMFDFGVSQSINPNLASGGLPQLLRCISILVLTTTCALNGNVTFFDRSKHGFNDFGLGNTLLPPSLYNDNDPISNGKSGLREIHERLHPSKTERWKRRDIAGILSASYGLLLRPNIFSLNSPHFNELCDGANDKGVDISKIFRACIEGATSVRSLSFARLSLLPCLKSPLENELRHCGINMMYDDKSFYLSALADFTSNYIDAICAFGQLPISRARWYELELAELNIRRIQEEERKHFNALPGQANIEKGNHDPGHIDVENRADCLEDVLALAIATCVSCPQCTSCFWDQSQTEEKYMTVNDSDNMTKMTQLKASRLLEGLESLRHVDVSILPSYTSFLSMLALASSPDDDVLSKSGADVVHDWLSYDKSTNSDIGTYSIPNYGDNNISQPKMRIDWGYVLNYIRHYAIEVVSGTNPTVPKNLGRSQISSSKEESSSYYYGVDDEITNYNESNASHSTPSNYIHDPRNKKYVESDEAKEQNLISLLTLVSCVGGASDTARIDLLNLCLSSMTLENGTESSCLPFHINVDSYNGNALPGVSRSLSRSGEQDDFLSVLFSILVSNVSSDVRGATLSAISNLVYWKDVESLLLEEDKGKVDLAIDTGRRVWNMLEESQIIPIHILDQFTEPKLGHELQNLQLVSGFRGKPWLKQFPGYSNMQKTSWFPPSQQYGLLYELEHVEVIEGKYPCTEGFLKLLSSLIVTVGCPSEVGSQSRMRTGCTPYIEVVTDFILPRILGSRPGDEGLPFATQVDRDRLLGRALEVIDAVIARYHIPPTKNQLELNKNKPNITINSSVSRVPNLDTGNSSLAQNNKANESSQTSALSGLTARDLLMNQVLMIQEATNRHGLGAAIMDSIFISNVACSFNDDAVDELVHDFYNADIEKTDLLSSSQILHQPHANESRENEEMNTLSLTETSGNKRVPRAKTPGFTVLSNILSKNNSSLFLDLGKILVLQQYNKNICLSNMREIALGLFRDSCPSRIIAQINRDAFNGIAQKSDGKAKTAKLFPQAIEDLKGVRRFVEGDDSIYWNETCVNLTLKILCAAAAREDAFMHNIEYYSSKDSGINRTSNRASSSLLIVPVLRFPLRIGNRADHLEEKASSSASDVRDLRISKLSSLLGGTLGSSTLRDMVPLIVDNISRQTFSLGESAESHVSNLAVSLVSYLCKNLSSSEYVPLLTGSNIGTGHTRLAAATAAALTPPFSCNDYRHSVSKSNIYDKNICNTSSIQHLILDILLSNTDRGVGNDNLSHIMLGFSGQNLKKEIEFVHGKFSGNKIPQPIISNRNTLDMILALASNDDIIFNGNISSLARKCYELIYCLCKPKLKNLSKTSAHLNCSIRLCILEKLRSLDFWQKHLDYFSANDNLNDKLFCGEIMESSMFNEDQSENNDLIFFEVYSNRLHSLAWLLKGVTVELRSLMGLDVFPDMGNNTNFTTSGLLGMISAQPTKLRNLMCYLFEGSNSVALKILGKIPLENPGFVKTLRDRSIISQLNINNFSKPLEGPFDVYGGYEVMDIERLNLELFSFEKSSSSEIQSRIILNWANKWNTYVSFVCASSHLANSWSFMLQNTVINCKSFQDPLAMVGMSQSNDQQDLFSKPSIMELISLLLSNLVVQNDNSHTSQDRPSPSGETVMSDVALHLTNATLSIIEYFIGETFSRESSDEFCFDEDELFHITFLIINAISCCQKDESNERVAVLSCGLSAIEKLLHKFNSMERCISNWNYTLTLRAGSSLLRLATLVKIDAKDDLTSYFGHVARSGLCSLINLMEHLQFSQDNSPFGIGNDYLLDLFGPSNPLVSECKKNLSLLVTSLSYFDNNVMYLLQNIASSQHGTQILMEAGITSYLLKGAMEYSSQTTKFDQTESYGSLIVEPPPFLIGHFYLLNSLLTYPPKQSYYQQLVNDACVLIKTYAPLGSNLLKLFPLHSQLTKEFVSILYLLSYEPMKSLDPISSSTSNNTRNYLASIIGEKTMKLLEVRIIDLTLHVTENPFPSKLLKPFPAKIYGIQKERSFNQPKCANLFIHKSGNWWDSLEERIVLPEDISSLQGAVPNSQAEIEMQNQIYSHAIPAFNFVHICLLYLSNQYINNRLSVDMDNISLGKSLSRMVDASREIETKYKTSTASLTGEISMMMNSTFIFNKDSSRISKINELRKKELDLLEELSPLLGRCVELLLHISYTKLNFLHQDLSMGKQEDSVRKKDNLIEYVSVMNTIFKYKQIESRDIGSTNPNADHEKNETPSFLKAICFVINKTINEIS